ncbi:hypothetical protein ACLOJK_009223 [Asimina triloba]
MRPVIPKSKMRRIAPESDDSTLPLRHLRIGDTVAAANPPMHTFPTPLYSTSYNPSPAPSPLPSSPFV